LPRSSQAFEPPHGDQVPARARPASATIDSSGPSRVLPAAAAPAMNASATPPSAQNSFSATVLDAPPAVARVADRHGAHPAPTPHRARPGCARRPPHRAGARRAAARRRCAPRPSPRSGASAPSSGRAEPHIRQPVDLAHHPRRPDGLLNGGGVGTAGAARQCRAVGGAPCPAPRPELIVDTDATLLTAHSDRQGAAPNVQAGIRIPSVVRVRRPRNRRVREARWRSGCGPRTPDRTPPPKVTR
jgi:hypothetical protein